jgi:competence protein ComEC
MPLLISILIATLLAISPSYAIRESFARAQFIVWNIGQGQWTTWVQPTECWHFDVGGEFDVSKKVQILCAQKLNRIFLSHWDWDHVGLVRQLKKRQLDLCLAVAPIGEASLSKKALIEGLPACSRPAIEVKSLFRPPLEDRAFMKKAKRTANHLSAVFWLQGPGILIPGDSTTDEEKFWQNQVPSLTRGLVLGHHGSRTSSSEGLLSRLQGLQWAVSSARKSRYGHPHAEIVTRLVQKKIPLLRTEDWGTLHFLEN